MGLLAISISSKTLILHQGGTISAVVKLQPAVALASGTSSTYMAAVDALNGRPYAQNGAPRPWHLRIGIAPCPSSAALTRPRR